MTAPVPVEPHPCHCHHAETARHRHPWLIAGGAFLAGEVLSERRHPLLRGVFVFTLLTVTALAGLVVFVTVWAWPLAFAAVAAFVLVRSHRRTHNPGRTAVLAAVLTVTGLLLAGCGSPGGRGAALVVLPILWGAWAVFTHRGREQAGDVEAPSITVAPSLRP